MNVSTWLFMVVDVCLVLRSIEAEYRETAYGKIGDTLCALSLLFLIRYSLESFGTCMRSVKWLFSWISTLRTRVKKEEILH